MEGGVKDCEPEVGSRHAHVECLQANLQVVTVAEVGQRGLCDWMHVLTDEVEHEPVAEGEFNQSLEEIADSDGGRCRVDVLVAAGGRHHESNVVCKAQVLWILQSYGKRWPIHVVQGCEVFNGLLGLLFFALGDAFEQVAIVVADVMETG